VITASDGEPALPLLEQFLPELAVLDVMMPKLTGIDVVGRRLRAHAATRDVRIILISAGFSDNVASRGPPGADDSIKKPFGVLEIPDRVQAVLAR